MSAASHNQNEDCLFYTARGFAKGEQVFHGFFGRSGGVSRGVYDSLNMGRGSDDNPANVKENFAIVAKQAGVDVDQVFTVHQVHSDRCVRVAEDGLDQNKRPEADALVTDVAGCAIGVLTADCAPVLFVAEKGDGAPVIGAAHAGWKGALGGVLDSTVKELKALGAEADSIRAAIGPCITQSSYEVDSGFIERFFEVDPENERFFKEAPKDGHFMFDLAGYCAARLASLGVKNVKIKDLDTYFNEEDFFSYRRATHRAEGDYGRQISLIAIQS